MRVPLTHICVYAGSNPGLDPAHEAAAVELGTLLGSRGISVAYGGGRVGLMGLVADAVLEAGGDVTGVIPRDLFEREVGHQGLTELIVVESMHERKVAMADRAQAFLALPGGLGTLEELFEAYTWTQLGIHAKPVGVLDVAGFYQPLLTFLDSTVAAGFLTPVHRAQLLASANAIDLLDQIAAWEPEQTSKWLDFEDR
ncbi:MAG: TIGR00730 family Rossman fold protein [Aquihabitans sp.]